ncbi:MAG: (d)CMP kinase [Fibrobacteraceae bacterium]|nr:(d)CMP kinase [Fibrobacteraceae bacterium]
MNFKKSHIIIAIDGPSGTGKSTTAKIIAKDLNLTYLDTGAMYRAITFAALEEGITPDDKIGMDQLLKSTRIRFDEKNQILINGILREKEIRGKEVSQMVSPYSAIPEVRSVLTEWQREIGNEQSCILDGRDIGTVVFPNADFKFFLITDLKVRAQRRFLECQEKGIEMSLEDIEKNLTERDRIDSSRATAPLRKADDAVEIDTTQLSIQEQVKKIEDRVSVVA